MLPPFNRPPLNEREETPQVRWRDTGEFDVRQPRPQVQIGRDVTDVLGATAPPTGGERERIAVSRQPRQETVAVHAPFLPGATEVRGRNEAFAIPTEASQKHVPTVQPPVSGTRGLPTILRLHHAVCYREVFRRGLAAHQNAPVCKHDDLAGLLPLGPAQEDRKLDSVSIHFSMFVGTAHVAGRNGEQPSNTHYK